ncbi:MAG: glycoside hydrolase family 28 protein, partial [Eubacterium sp.]
MLKKKRTIYDKLKTLLFGKDLRVKTGAPYTEVRAFDFSSYYPEEKYIFNQNAPNENIIDIRSYGADIKNEDNAPFINRAIEDAQKTGATVFISGGDYITSTVILKSNVTLFIDKGSALCANTSGRGYEQFKAIVYAENEENITLTGGGKIKGNGNLFGRKPVADKNNTHPAKYIDVIEMRRDYRSQLRFAHESKYGGPVSLKNCRNIIIDNFIIENSAYWTLKISNSRDITIKNFVINNNRNVANADGIDIAGSSNVNIKHCFISTADDGIVIKNAVWLSNTSPMENVNISDCEIISRTNAVKVGTETTYDISNININDCKLFMTDLYPGSVSGISLEACDGTALSNVTISDIEMDRCTCPVFIRLANRNRASKVNSQSANAIEFSGKAQRGASARKKRFDMKSEINGITIKNVNASAVEIPVIIAGFKQKGTVKRVKNVTLDNINIKYADIPETKDRRLFIPEYSKEYPECWRFRNLPSYALWIRHAENIRINNFTCLHSQPTWKKEIIRQDVI